MQYLSGLMGKSGVTRLQFTVIGGNGIIFCFLIKNEDSLAMKEKGI